MGHNKLNTKK